MKRVTASDARKNWFRLLDEVAAGEVVFIERAGKTIVLRREELSSAQGSANDYSSILSAPDAAEADAWHWSWGGPEGELRLEDNE